MKMAENKKKMNPFEVEANCTYKSHEINLMERKNKINVSKPKISTWMRRLGK